MAINENFNNLPKNIKSLGFPTNILQLSHGMSLSKNRVTKKTTDWFVANDTNAPYKPNFQAINPENANETKLPDIFMKTYRFINFFPLTIESNIMLATNIKIVIENHRIILE